MRIGLFSIYIFVNIFCFSALADIRVPDYDADESQARSAEIKEWLNEPLNGSFAYYTINQNVAPAQNGERYLIPQNNKFRVYGQPTYNANGLAVVNYRSPDVPGCFNTTCKMGVPKDSLKQVSSYDPNLAATLFNTFKQMVASGEKTACKGCETSVGTDGKPIPVDYSVTVKIPPPRKIPHPIDKTFAWLKNYLSCENYEYMLTQKQDLIEAEKIFQVPAPFMACLIARESRWNIYADQLNPGNGRYGSFKGLAQANADTLKTERNYINTDNKSIYRAKARRQWNAFMRNAPIGRMTPEHMYKKTGKYSTGRYWDQCGTRATTAEKDKIGRTAIAFVGTYINRIVDREAEFIGKTKGAKAERNFRNTKRSKYFAAAIGYNAGPGYVDDMLPPEGYATDSNAWMSKIGPPPYVKEKRKELGCTPAAVKAANQKKLKLIKPKGKGKKPYKPNPTSIRCTTEWISLMEREARTNATHKQGETRPYVKWIDICMRGNQSERPPMREKNGKAQLEVKGKGCGPNDPLKPCPPPPKPKPKPKPKAKPAAKKPAKKAPAKATPKKASAKPAAKKAAPPAKAKKK